MKSADVRRKFIEFFKARGHVEVPSASLVPENDPTTLFTSSGMQPLVPYLLGEPHPLGTRIVNSQKCFRAQDIEEVGNNRHTTFFEMLGNWSFGDYFKKEQLSWIWEFVTKELGLPTERLCVSVFQGDNDVPRDEESAKIWKKIGVAENKIFYYDITKNWWSRSGEPNKMPAGEPGGPDSEVFFEFTQVPHDPAYGKQCHPNCDCGRFVEIANSVFMQYRKKEDGALEELSNKNVDFGGGLERLVAATEDSPDMFMTDLLRTIIARIEEATGKTYSGNKGDTGETKAMRVIADHVKAAVMMMADGVTPGNKMQGYVLRRLIRRAVLYARNIGITRWEDAGKLVSPVAEMYVDAYPDVSKKQKSLETTLMEEARRFGKTLERGLTEVEKVSVIDGKTAFFLYESYGFPWEMTEEIAREKGQTIDRAEFERAFKKHQELSRTAAAGMFAGGLANRSEQVIKLHTATHLLHQALRTILGSHVQQKGSNITSERLRFDFSHPSRLTQEELEKVEGLVNEKIQENLPVSFAAMTYEEAINSGALAFFGERYPEKVNVYSIGNFSREVCGGPHVSFTGGLGHLTITKEESLGAGVRRIYATLPR